MSSFTVRCALGTHYFKYDPFGRRIFKSSSSGTSVFAYDGYHLVEETNGTGGVVARYTQTQNVDEPLVMLRGGAASYYEADGLGSVTSVSNASGALSQTYMFDSFGNQTASSGSLANSFRYTGRELDAETSLYYYRARYYDQTAGRFLSEDPVAYAGRISLYDYVGGNPTTYTDPSGNKKIYGNWCGPDWTGGWKEEYNPKHDRVYLPPMDNADYVCMQHDKCYYNCRATHPCNSGDRQNCMRVCDQNLIRDEPDTTWGNRIR